VCRGLAPFPLDVFRKGKYVAVFIEPNTLAPHRAALSRLLIYVNDYLPNVR